MNRDDVLNALFNIYDIKNSLNSSIKKRPKDNDGTETTIGDCIDEVIEFLEQLELVQ
jgi:hypothetical protein